MADTDVMLNEDVAMTAETGGIGEGGAATTTTAAAVEARTDEAESAQVEDAEQGGQKKKTAAAKTKKGVAGGTASTSAAAAIAQPTFPLARVSRIVKADRDVEATSKDAIWTIAVATELFIKHLTDSAVASARLDKKKTVTYKELANAVEAQNEFFFLQDIVPQPVALNKAFERRKALEEENRARAVGLIIDEDSDVEEEQQQQQQDEEQTAVGEEDAVLTATTDLPSAVQIPSTAKQSKKPKAKKSNGNAIPAAEHTAMELDEQAASEIPS